MTSRAFRPTIEELFAQLASDPKAFEKKTGKLAGLRAVRLRFNNAAWRLVFEVVEEARVVYCIALGPHDEAYRDAGRGR
jgi:hypothetical protein